MYIRYNRIMQVICKGIPIDYSEKGDGPTLLMVHGWGDSQQTWQALSQILSENFRCIMLDLPNFGNSGHSKQVATLETMSEALAEFAYKLKLHDYIFLGHSMGGQLGIYAVGSGLLRPKKLVILAGAGIRGEQPLRNTVFKVAAKIAKPLVSQRLKSKIYRRVGSDYKPDLSSEQKLVIQSVLTKDVQIEAAMIGLPTLLVYGSLDTATPPRYGQMLHKIIEGSQYRQLEGADHWLHQTHPNDVAKLVQGFAGA